MCRGDIPFTNLQKSCNKSKICVACIVTWTPFTPISRITGQSPLAPGPYPQTNNLPLSGIFSQSEMLLITFALVETSVFYGLTPRVFESVPMRTTFRTILPESLHCTWPSTRLLRPSTSTCSNNRHYSVLSCSRHVQHPGFEQDFFQDIL